MDEPLFYIVQSLPQPDGGLAKAYMAPGGHWHPDWPNAGFPRLAVNQTEANRILLECEKAGLKNCEAVPIWPVPAKLEAMHLRGRLYAVRPEGQLGSCGFSPVPWTVQFIKANSAEEAVRRARPILISSSSAEFSRQRSQQE